MTITEAINAAIGELESVRLPIRDAENTNHIRTALIFLDALKEAAQKQTTEKGEDEEPKGADEA